MDQRRMCSNCRAFITTSDRVCPYCGVQVGPRAIDRQEAAAAMAGMVQGDQFTTTMILILNAGLFIATLLASSQGGGITLDPSSQALLNFGGKYRGYIVQGQWWRLITAGFLHGGIIHILVNSWSLWDLGPRVEHAFGTPRYLTIYFVAGITGFAASTFWSPGLSIGASAAICGLIGAMVALGTLEKHTIAGAMRGVYLRAMLINIVIALYMPIIDNAAHIGGFAGGFVVAYLAGIPKRTRSDEGLWNTLSWVSLAITGYAFFRMFLWVRGPG